MAVLIALAVMCCACYSPNLRDCALACESADDCAGGQVCNAAHLCAMSDTTCSTDAAASGSESILLVHIDGSGTVTIAPCTAACTCVQTACELDAIAGVPTALVAIPHGDQEFAMWTGTPCAGQPATCAFTPPALTPLNVTFRAKQ